MVIYYMGSFNFFIKILKNHGVLCIDISYFSLTSDNPNHTLISLQ